jgi:PAS domain S-box-containing protein
VAEVDLIPHDDGPIPMPALSATGDRSVPIAPGAGAEVLRSVGLEPLIEWLETTSYGVCITGENHTWVYLNPAGERIIGGRLEELYGCDYLLHFPEHERAALLALEGNQRAGDTDFYTNTVLRPDGSEIQMTWSGSVITVDGMELAPAIFHETTQVRQAQREAVELAAMLHASATGAGGRTQTLEDLVDEAVHDTRACAAGLFLTQDDTGCLRLAAAARMEADADVVVAAAPVAVADLPGADDLTRGRSIFLSDAVSRYRADPRTEAWPAVVFGAEAAGAAQFPVWREGRVDGVLVVLFPTDVTSPSETDLALLSSLADQTSIVLGTDLVRRSASRASAFTERERIARDLHDSVSQGLFSLLARAQVVRRGLRAGNLELALEAAEDLEDLARQATGEMRELLSQLRTDADATETPNNRGTSGVELADELQRLADTVTRRDGLPVEVTLSPAVLPALSPQIAEHLVRIVGEAVHNAVKHAAAQQVLIAVTAQGATLTIEVRDDGVGFSPDTATGGLGQDTMRQRAALCGGILTVTSAPGSGTTVTVGVPLDV